MPRATKNPGIFAADAQTTIPPTPVVGVSYRDQANGLDNIRDGWPFKQIVNSPEFAQILHELTSLTDLVDRTGILEYKDDVEYDIVPAYVQGSDGLLYKSAIANGPGTGAGVVDPVGDVSGTWALFSETIPTVLSPDKNQWPTLSNTADADHDVTFSVGKILDSVGASVIDLQSALTKQIDATWAAGNNAGGLFTGTVAASTTYHCFVIVKDSDGSVDAGFDISNLGANIPVGYTAKRRIGSIITDGSANILPFLQFGDVFYHKSGNQVDLSTTTPATVTTPLTLSVPTGLNIEALTTFHLNHSAAVFVNAVPRTITIGTPSASNNVVCTNTNGIVSNSVQIGTDLNAQIDYISSVGSVLDFKVLTRGWIDQRII